MTVSDLIEALETLNYDAEALIDAPKGSFCWTIQHVLTDEDGDVVIRG